MNLIEITMSPRAWICLMFLITFFWMVVVSILLGINRHRDNKRAKTNEKEHEYFKKMLSLAAKVLRRVDGKMENSEMEMKRMSNLLQTKISPLMEKNGVIKELQGLLDAEREKFAQERKLTIQLGLQLKKANKILKETEGTKKEEEKNSKKKN